MGWVSWTRTLLVFYVCGPFGFLFSHTQSVFTDQKQKYITLKLTLAWSWHLGGENHKQTRMYRQIRTEKGKHDQDQKQKE
jgi:hypothetical protein